MPKTPTDLHDAETDIRPSPLERGEATELFGEDAPGDLEHIFGSEGVYSEPDTSSNDESED